MFRVQRVKAQSAVVTLPVVQYLADGHDLAGLLLEHCAELETVLIHALFEKNIEIGVSFFKNKNIKDKAVLIHTGWSKFFGTEAYQTNHPFVTEEAAIFLRDNGAKLVGIDSNNIDDTRKRTRPVHTILLRENRLITEEINSEEN